MGAGGWGNRNMQHNYYTRRAIEYWQEGAANRGLVESMIEAGGLPDRLRQWAVDMSPAIAPGWYADAMAYALDQVDWEAVAAALQGGAGRLDVAGPYTEIGRGAPVLAWLRQIGRLRAEAAAAVYLGWYKGRAPQGAATVEDRIARLQAEAARGPEGV